MGEFDLIARYFKRPTQHAVIGVGDDCALLAPTPGMHMAVSSDMLIFLDKNKLKSITYINSPEAHLFPEKAIPPNERKLKNFKWEEKRRPMKKSDIFTW